MGEIYRDIHAIQFDISDTFGSLMEKFYAIMRNHGICQGTWSEGGGRTISNPEWCMCSQVFRHHIDQKWNWTFLMSTPPSDLLAYGIKPKSKVK